MVRHTDLCLSQRAIHMFSKLYHSLLPEFPSETSACKICRRKVASKETRITNDEGPSMVLLPSAAEGAVRATLGKS